MANTKNVHFNITGGDSLTIYIITIQRSTKKDICGDTQLAVRNIQSTDPDYCTIAQMRMQRLISFRNRCMKKRRAHWRTNGEKLFEAFLAFKMNKKALVCQECQGKMEANSLTGKQLILFTEYPLCPRCRNTHIFEMGLFRQEAHLLLTNLI